jgi:Holliday junction resolvasome RuvABC DNA-binding subunit
MVAGLGAPSPTAEGVPGSLTTSTVADAAAALVSLGFTRNGAQTAAQEAVQELGDEATVEAVVRRALQQKVR